MLFDALRISSSPGRATVCILRASLIIRIVLFGTSAVPEARAGGTTVTIAERNQQAPGFPAGDRFEGFNVDGLNNSGQVLFDANVFGSNVYVPWLGRPGQLVSLPHGDYSILPSVNSSGQVAVAIDSRSARPGILAGLPGALTRVVTPGDSAPGAPGTVFGPFIDLNMPEIGMSDSGQLVLHAQLKGDSVNSSNDWGIWMGQPDDLGLVVREGQVAPGTPDGVTFRKVGDIVFNNTQVAFPATLMGPGITDANRSSVWVGNLEGLALVARADDPAPGMASGTTFSSVGLTDFSTSGGVALSTILTGPDVTDVNKEALWIGQAGSLGLVARTGDQAPGLPSGVTFSSFGQLKINAMGQVAFVAGVNGPGITGLNDTALWSGTPGNLSIIAREGDQVASASAGLVFHDDGSTNVFKDIALNSEGNVAFLGAVSGPGITLLNNDWVWLRNDAGLNALATQLNGPISINDVGQVAFVNFDWGNGNQKVLLFTPESVPEPNGFAMALVAIVLVPWRLHLNRLSPL